MKLELFCKKLAIHHWVIGLMFALTWNTVIAAPPSQTASEIERALSGASDSAQPGLQLRGGPGSGSPGLGRLRGPAGIVDDPVPVQAAPSPPVKPAATMNYPDLIRDRPKIAALIHFDSNSARIRDDAYPLLNEYVAALQSPTLANAMLLIAGHTDAAGSNKYNLILSGERAQAVRAYLIEHGVSPDRLIAKGYGEAYPVASNATETGREENRRSEFIRLDVSTRVSP
ncbi:MAG: OmpA family protein [Candidatus Competibacteraceae bacterium]|nr:OmpA family protein [Candidatus Competibacteraceae bacterium]MCP5125520.1 OmpA family protein [Gammaproteobacteria bacterium]